jgi:hypothetical protein
VYGANLREGIVRREDLGGRGELGGVDVGHCRFVAPMSGEIVFVRWFIYIDIDSEVYVRYTKVRRIVGDWKRDVDD